MADVLFERFIRKLSVYLGLRLVEKLDLYRADSERKYYIRYKFKSLYIKWVSFKIWEC